MIILPLAVFAAVFAWGGSPPGFALPLPSNAGDEHEAFSVQLDRCAGSIRYTCVVDGDTFWLRGQKVRIADINAPEISKPDCASEAELGERATQRLTDLLNEAPFSLQTVDRDHDTHGRLLRTVTRGGDSIGQRLVSEGLAERWQGRRGTWCDGGSRAIR